MANVVIREMHEEDLDEILKIERMSFSTPWSEAAFLNEIHKTNSLTRVALLNNKVVGYTCVNYIHGEAHILNLAVRPEFRRTGIATALMKDVIDKLKKKDCGFVYLEVRVSSMGARRFYERLGFKIVGVRRDYYQYPVEDAALMMLVL
ncbi:MAG: ribosomal protein S18-alanine N-acetyltransferase [Nitrospirota bacterium]